MAAAVVAAAAAVVVAAAAAILLSAFVSRRSRSGYQVLAYRKERGGVELNAR